MPADATPSSPIELNSPDASEHASIHELVAARSHAVLFALNERLEWVYLSARWQAWTQRSPESTYGQPAVAWFAGDDQSAVERYLLGVARDATTAAPPPLRLLLPFGDIRWVEVSAEPAVQAGQPYLVGTLTDVSAHHAAVEHLSQALQTAESTRRSTSRETWRWHVLTNQISVPTIFRVHVRALSGHTSSDFGQFLEAIDPRDRAGFSDTLVAHLASGHGFERRFRAGGTPRRPHWWTMAGQVTLDPSGRAVSITGDLRDLTREVEAAELGKRLAHVLETTTDIVFSFDGDGYLSYLNDAAKRTFGIAVRRDGDTETPRVQEFLDTASRDLLRETALPTAFREGVWRGEFVVRPLGAETAVPISTVIVLHPEDGEEWLLSGIARDISEEAGSLESLRDAKREALGRTQFLGQLVTSLANELGPRIAQVQRAVNELKTPGNCEYTHTLRAHTDSLAALTRETSVYALLQAGSLELTQAPLDLVAVLDTLVNESASVARQSGVELILDIMPGAALHGEGDPSRVLQMVRNVLFAALERTHTGHVRITLEDCRGGSTCSKVRVSVEDTGEPVPPSVLAQLDPSQPHPQRPRSLLGAGLGLAISHGLARLMGGGLAIESIDGVGTTCAIEFRLAPARPGGSPQRATVQLPGRLAYVYEPNPNLGLALLRALEARQLECFFADSHGGLEDFLSSSAAASQLPDLIVAPLEAGTYVAQRLAAHGWNAAVILLCGDADAAESIDPSLGVVHLLQKPVTWRELDATLAKLRIPPQEGRNVDVVRSPTTAPQALLHAPAVLVADAPGTSRDHVCDLLRSLGCQVTAVGSTADAVQAFLGHRFDLVLFGPPGGPIDGAQATAKMRAQDEVGNRVPIVASVSCDAEIDQCFEADMDGFLESNPQRDDLASLLTRYGLENGRPPLG